MKIIEQNPTQSKQILNESLTWKVYAEPLRYMSQIPKIGNRTELNKIK